MVLVKRSNPQRWAPATEPRAVPVCSLCSESKKLREIGKVVAMKPAARG